MYCFGNLKIDLIDCEVFEDKVFVFRDKNYWIIEFNNIYINRKCTRLYMIWK